MPKEKQMTLQEALKWLKDNTGVEWNIRTLKHAARTGKLNAPLQSAPVPYRLTTATALRAWLANPDAHQRGRRWKK